MRFFRIALVVIGILVVVYLVKKKSVDRNFELINAVIAADGNSLTEGNGVMPYTFFLRYSIPFRFNGDKIYNFGVGGQNTQQMIADAAKQVDPQIKHGVENVLIAWEVGNDLADCSPENAVKRFKSYCLARKKAGWKVFIVTLTPRDQAHPCGNSVGFNKMLQQCNALLRHEWPSFSDGIVDIANDNRLKVISSTYWQKDRVHLNSEGQRVVAELVKAEILGS